MSKEDNLKKGNPETQFSSENQPSAESKSKGWKKKRATKEIMESFLTNKAQESERELAEFFGFDTDEIDNRTLADLKQVQKAINDGDTKAYMAVMDRLYGKPIQAIQMEELNIKPTKYINATGNG